MKFLISALVLFIFSSCEQESKYSCVIAIVKSGNSRPSLETEKIFADNDSAAYSMGVAYYISRMNLRKQKPNEEGDIRDVVVYNDKGEEVSILLEDSIKRKIYYVHEQKLIDMQEKKPAPIKRQVDSADQQKAFEDIFFGEDFSDALSKRAKAEITIGTSEYHFMPLPDQNHKIYKVSLHGTLHDTEWYDTKVQKDFKNLVELITEKYGAPDVDRNFPLLIAVKIGDFNLLKEWKFGDKVISIGVVPTKKKSWVICDIYSESLKKIHDSVNNANKSAISSDASKF